MVKVWRRCDQQTTSHASQLQLKQQRQPRPKQTPKPAAAQPTDSSTRTDTQTGNGAVVLDHQPAPCVLCLVETEAEEPVGRLNIPGRSVRRPSPRACPPRARHSIDGKSPFRANRPRRCPECGSWRSKQPRRRSHSLAASRLAARLDRHHASSQMPCRDTHVRSFAGRHFELVRRGSRGAAAPHHRHRNLTVASEIHGKLRFLICHCCSWPAPCSMPQASTCRTP